MAQDQIPALDALNQRDVDAESSKPKIEDAKGKAKPAAIVHPPGKKPGKVNIKSPSGATDMLLDFSRPKLVQNTYSRP